MVYNKILLKFYSLKKMTGLSLLHVDKSFKIKALYIVFFGSPKGNRTPDTTVKGWCLNRLTMGPEEKFVLLFYFFRKEEAK